MTAAIKALTPVLAELGRDDLSSRVVAAGARLARPSTVVCVVGEFKQGKSSLVNGLLGTAVCPVDDDLATSAITLVRFGEQPVAVVRRHEGEKAVNDKIAVSQIGDWVSEHGNPDNRQAVERVDVAVPAAILKQGLSIVDTPGMGGLGAGHAAATLAFLPFADGLLFVSDASAELSAPEVSFLQQAADLCPTVMLVQTKIDLYPEWRRIGDLNRGHLARLGIDLPMVSVSNALRAEALSRKDRELNERSGYPAVISALDMEVVRPAKTRAVERSRHDVRTAVEQVTTGLMAERGVLTDPSRLKDTIATLEDVKGRIERLRAPSSRWNVLVGDRLADLSSQVNHDLRAGMRQISRSTDEKIETLKTGTEWDELSRDLQTMVAEVVTSAFVGVETGRQAIREEVLSLFADEQLHIRDAEGRDVDIDLSDMWGGKGLDEEGPAAGKAFRSGLTGVRGAYSGMAMFGMLGQFLPQATMAMIGATPVVLGVGAMFGALQLLDDRKRKLTMRRQAARTQMRQFVDDVQFQVGDELSQVIRELQRELRDEFSEGLGELQRTYNDTLKQTQESAQKSQAQAQERVKVIDTFLPRLKAVSAAIGSAS
jgi:hypothetical protein